MDGIPQDSIGTAPPPPSEVKIRTMRSDLESMAKSGGGMPQFKNVKVSGLSARQVGPEQAAQLQSKNNLLLIAIAIVAVIAVGIVGWFLYLKFFSQSAPQSQTSGTVQQAITQSQSNPVPVIVPTSTQVAAPFVHASFFATPADQVLTFALASSSAAGSATELQTYNQELLSLLATAKKTSNLIEIDAKDAGGNAASINELFAAANAQIIDPQVISTNFNPDPTFFAYRDPNGFWPGYVLALTPQSNWLFIQNDIQKLESSTELMNLFFTNPGMASLSGFSDSSVNNLPVRILEFTGGSAPSYFTYGWTTNHAYLILSTSENGFAVALQRLGQ